jgi:hypothetical protein
MSTSIRERELRSDSHKWKAVPPGIVIIFCMIGLAASLLLFSFLPVAPDSSDMANLIGP